MSHNVRKRTFEHVRLAKIQISLHIRAVWSESTLGTFWIACDAKFLHVHNIDSDQIVQIQVTEYVEHQHLPLGGFGFDPLFGHTWDFLKLIPAVLSL